MPTSKLKPAMVTIYLGKGEPEVHQLADFKDWAVIFEDVLEIKARDHTHYYPLDSVRKWIVSA
jgi:hypothetical protein